MVAKRFTSLGIVVGWILCWGETLPAAVVLRLSEKLPGLAMSLAPGETVGNINDRLCLQRPGDSGWCGRVVGLSLQGAIVKFDGRPLEWPRVNESLKIVLASPPKPPAPLPPTPNVGPPPFIAQKAPLPPSATPVIAARPSAPVVIGAPPTAVIPAPPAPTPPPAPRVAPREVPVVVAEPEMRKIDNPHHATDSKPAFRVLFDFLFTNRPGVTPPITFDTYHNLLWIEYYPHERVKFTAEVSQNPRFFEIGYQLTPRAQVRIGRIWIPFDDLGPHTLYGGRANVAKMSQAGGAAFLPDVWTDLGIAIRYDLYRNPWVSFVGHAYIVNGFQEGGIDPVGETDSYPSFDAVPLQDNNYDKAMGARIEMKLGNFFGAGASVYRGRFSNQKKESSAIFMFGGDTQLYITSTTELRFGYAYMNVNLAPPATEGFKRGGLYAELGQRIQRFKFLARLGQSQNDSRVLDTTDQTIVGGAIVYRSGPIQLSLEHSRDINELPGKTYYTFTGARLVSMF